MHNNNEVRNFKLENKLDREPKSLTPINIIIGNEYTCIILSVLRYNKKSHDFTENTLIILVL